MLALALAEQGIDAFFYGRGIDRDLFTRAIELERFVKGSVTFFLPSTVLGIVLFWDDDLDAARPLHERAARRAADHGEECDLGHLLVGMSLLEWQAGNLESAERYADLAAVAARQQVNEELDSWVAYQEGLFAAGRGELEKARTKLHEALALVTRSGNVMFITWTTMLLAQVDLWSGHPESAHALLQPLRERQIQNGIRFMGSMTAPMWSGDIEALIAIQRIDDADQVLADLLPRARASGNPHALAIAHRSAGLLVAARGDVAAAIDLMDAALEAHAARPVPFEVGRTLLEKGSLQRRAKRKSVAKRTLEETLEILEPLRAGLWIARAQDELTRIGLRRAKVTDGLTPAQARVAELVAAGLSNQEIAGTLYMSTRSVESHLTKIYREFGVRSRGQLLANLAGRSESAKSHPQRAATSSRRGRASRRMMAVA